MMSPVTSRKLRLFSNGIRARLAPLSMATWSGSTSERSPLMFPWTLRSPMTSKRGDWRCLLERRKRGDEEAESDLALDAVVEQVDDLDVEI